MYEHLLDVPSSQVLKYNVFRSNKYILSRDILIGTRPPMPHHGWAISQGVHIIEDILCFLLCCVSYTFDT
jgi:hypothetical protein